MRRFIFTLLVWLEAFCLRYKPLYWAYHRATQQHHRAALSDFKFQRWLDKNYPNRVRLKKDEL